MGMDADAALAAVTRIPADILGVSAQVGTLEPGKRADVVIWSSHPLDLGAEVLAVFSGGERVPPKSGE